MLGFGIGGEYPISASSSAENSATKNRGQTVALTFSMQGIGNFAGAFIGNLLVQGLARNTDGHYENSHLQVILASVVLHWRGASSCCHVWDALRCPSRGSTRS